MEGPLLVLMVSYGEGPLLVLMVSYGEGPHSSVSYYQCVCTQVSPAGTL